MIHLPLPRRAQVAADDVLARLSWQPTAPTGSLPSHRALDRARGARFGCTALLVPLAASARTGGDVCRTALLPPTTFMQPIAALLGRGDAMVLVRSVADALLSTRGADHGQQPTVSHSIKLPVSSLSFVHTDLVSRVEPGVFTLKIAEETVTFRIQ